MYSLGISKNKLPLLILGGVLTGLLNGLLGAGGGIACVFILKKVLADTEADSRDVFANTIAVILPLCAFSLCGYAARGGAALSGASFFILPALAGGAAGGLLLGRLKADTLSLVFGILILVSGILMLGGR